jgi:hypothetical protein
MGSSGTYQERYISTRGCDSIHFLRLTINKNVGIYYPNVVHPGGPNGWFTLFDNGITISIITSLSIYDRWGEVIWQRQGFAANELEKGWNGKFRGKNVLPSVYVWHAQITLKDVSVVTEKGDVTVVR